MREPNLLSACVAVALAAAACTPAPTPTGEPKAGDGAQATAATAGTSSAPSATTSPSTPSEGGAGAALVGKWFSPKCGARTYRRELELLAGGRFRADDLVSPCPPDAKCVWSGIVTREGTWKVDPNGVALTVDKEGKGPATGALPASLGVSGSILVETNGTEMCSYGRN